MPIRFFQEDIIYTPNKKAALKKWITYIIALEGSSTGEINYIFCSDEYLLRINKNFLDHDYYTDIITFDQAETGNAVQGDIYISVDRVKENAVTASTTFDEELRRVMIHGVLHLLGFNDRSEADKKMMRKKEEGCLSLYPVER